MQPSTHANAVWRNAVEALAPRTGGIDLSPDTPEGPVDFFRSRLLAITPDGGMLVERPGFPGISTTMATGRTVYVTLVAEGKRWQGAAPVLGLERVALNANTPVPALRLGPAGNIRSGQRRQFFRIALAPADLRTFAVATLDDAGNARPLSARVVNLSAGGLGIIVPTTVQITYDAPLGAAVRCRLDPAATRDTYDLAARVVHVEPMPERQTYLGLEFRFDDPATRLRTQDALIRLVTEIERRQLQRFRGA